MGSGVVIPAPSFSMLLHSLLLTVEWRVWSYGVWYCCAPLLPLDPAVFSRFDVGAEVMVLRGLISLCPFPPS